LMTHRRILVAATPEEIVVIETTRDLDPVAVLARLPRAEWQPSHGWGTVSHPIGNLDIVVVGAALRLHPVTDGMSTSAHATVTSGVPSDLAGRPRG
ncbi:MAG: hypothetical protein ACRCZP_06815, partial [Phycicoccus sp.]